MFFVRFLLYIRSLKAYSLIGAGWTFLDIWYILSVLGPFDSLAGSDVQHPFSSHQLTALYNQQVLFLCELDSLV